MISKKPDVKKTNPNKPNDKIGKMSAAYQPEGCSITPFLRAQRHQTQFKPSLTRFHLTYKVSMGFFLYQNMVLPRRGFFSGLGRIFSVEYYVR